MSKRSKIFVSVEIPEWGVSPRISTAVPIAASGTEIKSTRQVSASMNALLRGEIKKLKADNPKFVEEEVVHLKNLARVKPGPTSGTFFRAIAPGSQLILKGNIDRPGVIDVNRVRSKTVGTRTLSKPSAARKRR